MWDTAETLAQMDDSMERLEDERWREFLAGKPAWRFFYGLAGEWAHQEANELTWEQARERVAAVLAGFADDSCPDCRATAAALTEKLGALEPGTEFRETIDGDDLVLEDGRPEDPAEPS